MPSIPQRLFDQIYAQDEDQSSHDHYGYAKRFEYIKSFCSITQLTDISDRARPNDKQTSSGEGKKKCSNATATTHTIEAKKYSMQLLNIMKQTPTEVYSHRQGNWDYIQALV